MARRKKEILDWYVSDRKWRRFAPDVRRDVLQRVPRTELLGNRAEFVAARIRETAPTQKLGVSVSERFLDEVERIIAEGPKPAEHKSRSK